STPISNVPGAIRTIAMPMELTFPAGGSAVRIAASADNPAAAKTSAERLDMALTLYSAECQWEGSEDVVGGGASPRLLMTRSATQPGRASGRLKVTFTASRGLTPGRNCSAATTRRIRGRLRD